MAEPLVPDELWEAIAPLLPRHKARPGKRGRPRRKPKALYGDRQYGTPRNQRGLKERGFEDHLARQRTPPGSGLGKVRWVVEGTLSWVGQARRLKVRYDVLPVGDEPCRRHNARSRRNR